jgi:hypothetical protein
MLVGEGTATNILVAPRVIVSCYDTLQGKLIQQEIAHTFLSRTNGLSNGSALLHTVNGRCSVYLSDEHLITVVLR